MLPRPLACERRCAASAGARPAQELILFSRADLERSIPSLVDGLKPGQRKILYCAFKRNLKKDIKARLGRGAWGWDGGGGGNWTCTRAGA